MDGSIDQVLPFSAEHASTAVKQHLAKIRVTYPEPIPIYLVRYGDRTWHNLLAYVGAKPIFRANERRWVKSDGCLAVKLFNNVSDSDWMVNKVVYKVQPSLESINGWRDSISGSRVEF